VTVHLDVSGTSGTLGDLAAGYQATGILSVHDGVIINSANGYLGYNAGANGTAVVDGAGSAWNISGKLNVGNSGAGMLTISNGGIVSDATGTWHMAPSLRARRWSTALGLPGPTAAV